MEEFRMLKEKISHLTVGRMPPECTQYLNRLAELHNIKKNARCQDVIEHKCTRHQCSHFIKKRT